MMRPTVIGGLVLLAVMVTGLFELKYEVRSLDQQKASLQRQIAGEEEALRVLQAEWSFLNQPDRIQELARRYLALDTPAASQIGGIDRIPFRAPDDEVAQIKPETRIAQ
jgi:cell division protein FtsL